MRTQFGEQLRYQTAVSVRPAGLPVHRDAVKLHARLPLDLTAEDSLIDDYIRDAVHEVEKDSNRSLVVRTMQLFVDRFPLLSYNEAGRDMLPTNSLELRHCPVTTVDSITYVDYNGTQQTWASNQYQVNTADEPAIVRYVWGGQWPVARLQEKSICVTYHAGYLTPISVTATNTITLNGRVPVLNEVVRVSNSGGLVPGGLATEQDYYVINVSGQACQLSLSSGGSAVAITNAGSGLSFLGEINPLAKQAIYYKVALNYADRESAEYKNCVDGYWAKIYGLRYEGW